MNYSLVIIGVLFVVILYLLYMYMFDTSKELKDFVKIDNAINLDIASESNTRYAYGVWVYLGQWNNNNNSKVIYTHGEDNGGLLGGKLELSATTPTLKYSVLTDNSNQEITVMDNFPVQKWSHIIVSVDNNIVDFYLDGKLVRSANMGNVVAPSSSSVTLGAISNAHIARFTRWTSPLNPQAAYDVYMQGNGQTGMLPSYGMDVSLFKDNIEQSKFKLF